MASQQYIVDSPKVQYIEKKDVLLASYSYQSPHVVADSDTGKLRVTPTAVDLTFKTNCKIPRVGCMLVGWGGNNGSTLTASVLANKLNMTWRTKEGTHQANYYGSLTQASTTSLGIGADGKDVYIPLKDLLPMINPNDIEFDGTPDSKKY